MNLLLGDLTVILNVIVIILVVISIFLYFKRKSFDMQFLFLLGGILLLQPVIIFENILYLEIAYGLVDYNYGTIVMRIFFALGTIAYFVYNLHLMTIADIPSLPVAITGIITGFGIGTMGISAQVNDNLMNPIYYEPIGGGIFFISSLMLFNIIGASGFFISIIRGKNVSLVESVSTLDMFGLFFFFISPMAIFITRIMGNTVLPVNAIFLVTLLGFSLHLLSYILTPDNFGYPLLATLISLSIIDIENSVVLAGLSTQEDENFNKLQGMTIMAVDSVIKDVFEAETKNSDRYSMNYGDTILIRNGDYLLVSLFLGKGKKVGNYVLDKFLDHFQENEPQCNKVKFKKMVNNYLHALLKKKLVISNDHLFLSSVNGKN